MGVESSGNIVVGSNGMTTGSFAASTATMADTLTFQIPGAATSTVTNIGISYQLNGGYTIAGFQPSAAVTVQMQFGGGTILWRSVTGNSPPNQVAENIG